jgi:hypothetical protein
MGGAWTYATIHTFAGGTADGANSRAGITFGAKRVLYGTTSTGGTLNEGVVFQLTPPPSPGSPWTETILHSFQGSSSNADGLTPFGGVILNGGILVGTTLGGGFQNSGAVYAVIP